MIGVKAESVRGPTLSNAQNLNVNFTPPPLLLVKTRKSYTATCKLSNLFLWQKVIRTNRLKKI
jgi:hypothetical protein